MLLRFSNRWTEPIRQNSSLANKLKQAVSGGAQRDREAQLVERSETDVDENGESFREMYVMPKRKLRGQLQLEQITGRTAVEERSRMDIHDRLAVRRPRSEEMKPEQDWPSVWPSAKTYNSSVVPLPVRMGSRPNPDKRAPFKKQGNLELVKIPNFLHLTPAAIQKHCEAIKKFCTEYPVELKEDAKLESEEFPVQLHYNTYVHQGTSIRDNRSRVVTMSLKVGSLNLKDVAREKLIRLAGNRYDEATDTLTILTDRCHTRKQNLDYANYLITVLYHESNKVEDWEKLKETKDSLKVQFAGSECEKQLVNVLKSSLTHDSLQSPVKGLGADADAEAIAKHPKVDEFAKLWHKYRNEKETPQSTREYANAVRQLLGIQKQTTQSKHSGQ